MPYIGYTSAEMAVLDRLKQGKPNKVIAFELAMSESSVKAHIQNIMKKNGQRADKARRRLVMIGAKGMSERTPETPVTEPQPPHEMPAPHPPGEEKEESDNGHEPEPEKF